MTCVQALACLLCLVPSASLIFAGVWFICPVLPVCGLWPPLERSTVEGTQQVSCCWWTHLSKQLVEVWDVGRCHGWAVAQAPPTAPAAFLFTRALFLPRRWLWAVKSTFMYEVLRGVNIRAHSCLSMYLNKDECLWDDYWSLRWDKWGKPQWFDQLTSLRGQLFWSKE